MKYIIHDSYSKQVYSQLIVCSTTDDISFYISIAIYTESNYINKVVTFINNYDYYYVDEMNNDGNNYYNR